MQTKQVFIVTYDYPPSNGGIARLCFELKKNLEKRNQKLTIITRKNDNTDAENDKNVVRLSYKLYCPVEKPIFWHMVLNI